MLRSLFALTLLSLAFAFPALAAEQLKALIVDGQNNHKNWPQTTQMMKSYLEGSGMFSVDVATTAKEGTDPSFAPKWSDYDVVISNYNGAEWPQGTKKSFVEYVNNGGGFVVVHAANNAFGGWQEYNEIIGLGGWGGRNEGSGPYVYFDDRGQLVRDEAKGSGGSHGAQHPFAVWVRDDEHPVTRGMPAQWMHANDELYDRLRGPAANTQVLATAYADPAKGGSGRHEPMIFTVEYGKGRVFHTPMGHGIDSQECVGFITTLVRGAEWAATDKVTTPIPDDFPGEEEPSRRPFAAK
ncbi:MAG TPA: ThuA domain-containing protein [Pirellulaceae bacterium]|jgi:type 1 glutamine amidotransferase|nr:ThuA domain-containing protein [Pirellulaceae bacterium]